MPSVLIVAPRDLEPDLGRTVVWRGDVDRVWVRDPAHAVVEAARVAPSLVVLDGGDPQAAQLVARSLRFHDATRSTSIAVVDRSFSPELERGFVAAGATVILPAPVDPLLWDNRLQELLHVPPRRDARIPVRLDVWSRYEAEQEQVEGTALNISLRGILLETDKPLPLGVKLDISFRLPGDATRLRVVGQVVRRAGPDNGHSHSGIAFLVLRGEARNRIGSFVEFSHRTGAGPRWPEGAADLPEGKEWEAQLRASEARKAAILDAALDCMITLDHEGKIVEFNAAAERTFGFARSEVFGRRAVETLAPAELREEARQRLAHFLATGERGVLGARIETRALRADGASFPAELAVAPIYVNGRVLLAIYLRDITERRRLESMGEAEHETARALAEATTVSEAAARILAAVGGGLGWDCAGLWLLEAGRPELVAAWPTARQAAEFAPAAAGAAPLLAPVLVGQRALWLSQLTDDQSWDGARSAAALPILVGNQTRGGIVLGSRSPRSAEPDLLQRLQTLGSQIGQFIERRRAEENLDRRLLELREAEAALRRMARFDSLTGLPNRTSFLETLDRTLLRARRRRSRVGLIFVDLDGFKAVNDNLGHEAGDALLRLSAERLRTAIRGSDMVARMGGDEFTVVVQDLDRGDDAALVAQKVLEQIARPCRLAGREVLVGASAGISVYPDDGRDSQTLLRHADLAMYRAKEDGKNTYRFFTASMSERARQRMAMEVSLRRALQRDEFLLHYQPEVREDGVCTCLEALIRWKDPELGLVAPLRFIPHAEETGLILPIGLWVLRTACRFGLGLGSDVRVAINLSARQLLQPDAARVVEQVLNETGLDPRRLELEVTESAIMSEAEEVAEGLRRLSHSGVQLTLDDFGTGYSSLSHLKRLRIHRIKIDRTFVQDLPDNPDSVAIVTAIVGLADGLGLEVIAEGVETEAQRGFLREHGCRFFQGRLLSAPLPPADVVRFLRRPGEPG